MRWFECCIKHLVLYGIVHYYTTQSTKIPIIHTHSGDNAATLVGSCGGQIILRTSNDVFILQFGVAF